MLPPLTVSENRRFLVTEEGEPFFYLGDTAWELFHRLNREESDLYLTDRAAKGFNVIQAVALAEHDGLHVPNAYGHRPLVDDDPSRPAVVEGPGNDYWDHVDWVVDRAASLGLYTGLLPTWGDKWNKKWGVGPVVFTPENARQYGRWIASRYKDRPIIWILGGDRPIEEGYQLEIIRGMAAGIREAVDHTQLITFHPSGWQSSSQWLHDEEWLDFNMIQSGHAHRNAANYRLIERDLELRPAKPAIDGEPRYEDIDVSFKAENGRFEAWDVRQAAWWSVFSGAFGHTYGTNSVWQMWTPGRKPVLNADLPWSEALQLPGAGQMGILRRFAEDCRYWQWVPDQTLVRGENLDGPDHVRAVRSLNRNQACFYLPRGKPVLVDLSGLDGKEATCSWYNPRNGEMTIGESISTDCLEPFSSPESGDGLDWVLVVDVPGLD